MERQDNDRLATCNRFTRQDHTDTGDHKRMESGSGRAATARYFEDIHLNVIAVWSQFHGNRVIEYAEWLATASERAVILLPAPRPTVTVSKIIQLGLFEQLEAAA